MAMISEVDECIRASILEIIPNAEMGSFQFTDSVFEELEFEMQTLMLPFKNYFIFCYAIPITEDGLWVWYKHANSRSLMANYILRQAFDNVSKQFGDERKVYDIAELTGNRLSMVEIAVRCGLGTRGLNNLLLHPRYGSWMQLAAILFREALPISEMLDYSVCIECSNCISACPVQAIANNSFQPRRCSAVVASPDRIRSKAVALTQNSYIECRECISNCPIGEGPIKLFNWKNKFLY